MKRKIKVDNTPSVPEGKFRIGPATNFQRITESPEKLAEFINEAPSCPPTSSDECSENCQKCWLDWLNAPEMEDK